MCKFKMPKDTWFNKKKTKYSVLKWTVGLSCVVVLAWFMPEYTPDKLKFHDMHPDDLQKSIVKINSIDFLSTSVKEKHAELSSTMPAFCKDDVLFGFQFSKENRTIQDHLFMLCSSKKILANAEIIYSDDHFVMCTEQYADIVKRVKRSSSVVIKAIDIDTWDIVEYKSMDTKEACIIQHAVDVLNSRWV